LQHKIPNQPVLRTKRKTYVMLEKMCVITVRMYGTAKKTAATAEKMYVMLNMMVADAINAKTAVIAVKMCETIMKTGAIRWKMCMIGARIGATENIKVERKKVA
jgi:hypothetical protein